jgi:hypothetical protein
MHPELSYYQKEHHRHSATTFKIPLLKIAPTPDPTVLADLPVMVPD